MPTLNWIGKDKVVNHHLDVPFRTLERQYTFAPSGQDDGNMIIHGDNLEALKALLPQYEGRIRLIYIDPPYNTGNEGWVYNDNVNDPRIRKWLGQVVGKEGEDLSRHDKWLCMMYPRLRLLQKLLHPENGVIFISIDENEIEELKMLCNEIFGRNHHVATVVWQKRYSRENRGAFGDAHEYLLVYASNKDDLTDYERHELLSQIVEIGYMTIADISNHLEFLINMSGPSHPDSMEKWKSDLKYITEYKLKHEAFVLI